ncbi:hypothetical protein HKX48_005456 [Thoreauomyces humboldtii]|nr:hypothetical protein HKX48_005456 [Thoreauomyces humboldtii]
MGERTLQFKDNFWVSEVALRTAWGCPGRCLTEGFLRQGQEQNGPGVLSSKVGQGIESTKELVDMLGLRAALEEDYAKGLANIIHSHPLRSGGGTVQQASMTVQLQSRHFVTAHSTFAATILSDLVPLLQSLLTAQKTLKRDMDASIASAAKNVAREAAAATKAQATYSSRCRDIREQRDTAIPLVVGGDRPSRDKAQIKAAAANVARDVAERELRTAIARHANAVDSWEECAEECAVQVEASETARADVVKEVMQSFVAVQGELFASAVDDAIPAMRDAVEKIDGVQDNADFVMAEGTGTSRASRIVIQRPVSTVSTVSGRSFSRSGSQEARLAQLGNGSAGDSKPSARRSSSVDSLDYERSSGPASANSGNMESPMAAVRRQANSLLSIIKPPSGRRSRQGSLGDIVAKHTQPADGVSTVSHEDAPVHLELSIDRVPIPVAPPRGRASLLLNPDRLPDGLIQDSSTRLSSNADPRSSMRDGLTADFLSDVRSAERYTTQITDSGVPTLARSPTPPPERPGAPPPQGHEEIFSAELGNLE